jgi:hypothetical protein
LPPFCQLLSEQHHLARLHEIARDEAAEIDAAGRVTASCLLYGRWAYQPGFGMSLIIALDNGF